MSVSIALNIKHILFDVVMQMIIHSLIHLSKSNTHSFIKGVQNDLRQNKIQIYLLQ